MGGAEAYKKGQEREQLRKEVQDLIVVHLKLENPNNINFEKMFQGDLPPQAKQLEDFVNKFKDKDTSKDKDIQKYKKVIFQLDFQKEIKYTNEFILFEKAV